MDEGAVQMGYATNEQSFISTTERSTVYVGNLPCLDIFNKLNDFVSKIVPVKSIYFKNDNRWCFVVCENENDVEK